MIILMMVSNKVQINPFKAENTKPKKSQLIILLLFGICLALIAGEVLARVLVRWKWTPEKICAMTTHTAQKGH